MNAQPPGGTRKEIPTDAEIDRQSKSVDLSGKRVNLRLRIIFALVFLALALTQIAIADRFLWVYAEHRDWEVPTEVIIAFLSATVVEVLGVVAIIVKYLFDRTE